ncbi:hypothetical protein [Apilactobacillus xinyiensis]|uniref:hypothetical protein n=1 Tax=Apilactobacillus xinyiensis TaxID=2841032 RepID=UPI00200F211B|nr:hypothetical protein [Apilactobacillus xinyiensis]MCL0330596.1 hypothetical protein [Apilactobacillus xinyiensis]
MINIKIYKHVENFIHAFKWDGYTDTLKRKVSKEELSAFSINKNGILSIHTDNGTMQCAVGDYVIQEDYNRYHCCKPEMFRKLYKLP